MTDASQSLLKTKGENSKAKGRIRRMVVLDKEEVSEERKRKRKREGSKGEKKEWRERGSSNNKVICYRSYS